MSNVSVITGGTSGIGRAIVLRIIEEAEPGDKIYINYGHSDEAAAALLDALPRERRDMAELIKADLSDYDAMYRFAETLRSRTDHVDWLVLNTGVGTYASFDDYTSELWDRVMRTNVSVPALLVQQLKPLMAENGSIVFMGSHAGQMPYSRSVVYSVSKAAVMFLAKSLVKIFDEQRVRVNAIAPGFIETRWQKDRTAERCDRINRKIAAHRFGTPAEVAELCYTLLTNEYLNGSIYDIHGGYDYF